MYFWEISVMIGIAVRAGIQRKNGHDTGIAGNGTRT
jgi:hypothetical protein